LDKAFLDKMKNLLLEMKEEILHMLAEESNDFKKIVEDMDPKDMVDIAADDIGKNTLDALGAVEMRKLRQIEAALGRIENGRYGYCMESGDEIPKERLEAIPYALYTVACQAEIERQRRRTG
jgi:DnaK suppressor protein